MSNFLLRFSRTEAFSGVLIILAAASAVLWANLATGYTTFWHTQVSFGLGSRTFTTDLEYIIGEVAMSAFFLVVGLEIRRELASGHLATRASRVAPIVAAVAGTVLPAAIFLAFALSEDRNGWPIPTATDIALVMGVFGLLSTKLHPATRVLLLSIAVLDDVIGIGLLALLSTAVLQPGPLCFALAISAAMTWLGRHREPPISVLLLMWVTLLILLSAGGLHPSLSGALVALAAPSRRPQNGHFISATANPNSRQPAKTEVEQMLNVGVEVTPVERLELALLPWVSYLVLPIFVLSHAGVTFDTANQTTVAVALGLAVGKPVALISSLLLGRKLRLLTLTEGIETKDIVVVGLLCGAGLTVSSLLASAALPDAGPATLGVLIGSTFAIVAATSAALLPTRTKKDPNIHTTEDH